MRRLVRAQARRPPAVTRAIRAVHAAPTNLGRRRSGGRRRPGLWRGSALP